MTRGEGPAADHCDRPRDNRRRTPADEVWDDPGSHRSLIEEDAFIAHLVDQAGTSLRSLLGGPSISEMRACHAQVEHALEIETLLDDFEARHNRQFVLFAELVSSLRCLGRAAQCLHHLRAREPQYYLCWPRSRREDFADRCEDALEFLDRCFARLQFRAGEECLRWGFATGAPGATTVPAGARAPEMHLPHDLDTGDDPHDEAAVARLFGSFRSAHSSMQSLAAKAGLVGVRDGDTESFTAFFAKNLDEIQARDIEARLHSLQSAYDTFLRSTPLERTHPRLRSWRGHISMAYHLAEMVTQLVHFSERHEDAIQHTPTRTLLAELVDRQGVLRTAHFGLIAIGEVLDEVAPLNEQLRKSLVPELLLELTIPEGAVLHARPLSLIAQTVTRHGTPVELEIAGDTVPASSLLAMLLLAGSSPETRQLSFRGDRDALRALAELFEGALWNGEEFDTGAVPSMA